ncbi:SusD/RagB family nutrient-binding outer membrane lipoprotein [Hymenobacter sp. BT186]|uniref:SusD/RagB family nutrient-binding outer membrane lipoprotein n=1 Tax=Hymenobacter telluris TaxID=2816474 RepID=A0A939EVQ4_9BACT|nr:SusD/RagB family nutrient-binding outer membrane lipoprotein [Hymenobacter telluris]MBO0358709.1 SusD/RagB family nutrient-binding outer membrane lipoprotein [Hymenobacter telluris]MBW3374735.1 SusD/RagB family nutrient-binding outer membrane lipoprotein [Hymenobacter norwichensis]
MKVIHKYLTLPVAALGLSLSACQDFVKDLDVNPNAPATADALNMLQGVELGDALVHEGDAARIASMWANTYTGVGNQYLAVNQYVAVTSDFSNLWSTIYLDVLTQSRIATQRALEENNPLLSGIFQIIEAHTMGTATSLFGDIPFRQAGDRLNYPNPVFDPQVQVYADLQKELKTAIAKIAQGGGAGNRDIFYSGNPTKWTQAAYTLRARYYLHTQQYDSARLMALQGISSPANDWLMPHREVDGAENFYYQFQNERGGYLEAFGSRAARLLDPIRRLPGNRNNTKTDETERFNYFFGNSQTSNPDEYLLPYAIGITDPSEDFPLLTYSENQLILAEASARQNNLTAALAALNDHRQALLTKFPNGIYAPYVLSDIPGGGTRDNLILEILNERYVSFIGQIEPFNDARRTKNALGLARKSTTAPRLPQRFLYPQSEINTNTSVPNPIPSLFDNTTVNPQ